MGSEPQVGDVVRLQSGGPDMTVFDITIQDGNAAVKVAWVANDGNPCEAQFPAVCVALVRVRGGAVA